MLLLFGKYYPNYIELKEKLLLHIKDQDLRAVIENTLMTFNDVFWVNAKKRIIFNDLTFQS